MNNCCISESTNINNTCNNCSYLNHFVIRSAQNAFLGQFLFVAKDLLSSDLLRCFVQKKYRKIYDAATRYTTIQYILAQVKTVLKYSFSSPFKQFPNSSPPTSLFKYFHFFTHHYHLRFTLPSVNTTIAQLHRIFSLGAEVYFS